MTENNSKSSILYHYCSAETFKIIIEKQTIRLSSLDHSNDYLEGKIIIDKIKKHADNLFEKNEGGLNDAQIEAIKKSLDKALDFWAGLGFCLSEKGDLLSQWRGYAADATGFSIGFNKRNLIKYIETNQFFVDHQQGPISLVKILYNDNELNDGAKHLLERLDKLVISRKKTDNQEFINELAKAGKYRYTFKKDGFSEEAEWRILACIRSQDFNKLNFLISNKSFKPFFDMDFSSSKDLVSEVVVGPKQSTSDVVLENFLKKNGFDNVNIRRSNTSFR